MKPMLCQPMKLESAKETVARGEWVAERKWDGVRGYIENGRLYDRREKEITDKFPEFEGLKDIKDVLDGEVVCETFNEMGSRIHTRDKFAIKLLAKKCPAKFVAFDIVVPDVPLSERRKMLEQYAGRFPWLEVTPVADDVDALWKAVMDNGWEGIVIKRKSAPYQFGTRSPDWLKVKAFAETVAVFTKMDEHPKGVRLETDDGKSVNVNGAQAQEVRAEFKRTGRVTCEVQFLPQADSEAWRFPSFRGLVDG